MHLWYVIETPRRIYAISIFWLLILFALPVTDLPIRVRRTLYLCICVWYAAYTCAREVFGKKKVRSGHYHYWKVIIACVSKTRWQHRKAKKSKRPLWVAKWPLLRLVNRQKWSQSLILPPLSSSPSAGCPRGRSWCRSLRESSGSKRSRWRLCHPCFYYRSPRCGTGHRNNQY